MCVCVCACACAWVRACTCVRCVFCWRSLVSAYLLERATFIQHMRFSFQTRCSMHARMCACVWVCLCAQESSWLARIFCSRVGHCLSSMSHVGEVPQVRGSSSTGPPEAPDRPSVSGNLLTVLRLPLSRSASRIAGAAGSLAAVFSAGPALRHPRAND